MCANYLYVPIIRTASELAAPRCERSVLQVLRLQVFLLLQHVFCRCRKRLSQAFWTASDRASITPPPSSRGIVTVSPAPR